MSKNSLPDIYFFSWYKNFARAIAGPRDFLKDLLEEKLFQQLFFFKMEHEVFPSYMFGSLLNSILCDYATPYEPFMKQHKKEFLKDPEGFLKIRIKRALGMWRYFPQVLREFWVLYPRYNLEFDNVECIYLDFWKELPKVFDSLLSELLVRDAPLREMMPNPPHPMANVLLIINDYDVFPPIHEDGTSKEELTQRIVEYLSGEEGDKRFFKVISFYLNARPSLKEECSSDLLSKGLPVTDDSLVKYFLGGYMFKGVSSEAIRFLVANSPLHQKNPIKEKVEEHRKSWLAFEETTRQDIIRKGKEGLEEYREILKRRNAMSLEEKEKENEEAIAALNKIDFASLPTVSSSDLIISASSSSFSKSNKEDP